jgi:hypothetical protein
MPAGDLTPRRTSAERTGAEFVLVDRLQKLTL